jgi:16S rRNA (cytosine967-C5)-methyltransferase
MRVTGVLMGQISRARAVAFNVLLTVASGAYASDTLREHTRELDSRDAGLAAQIVFGCLRFQSQLDYLISRYSGRSLDQLDRAVAIILRTAIFQLRYLERIPAHAAVHESVELAKRHKRAAAGFINAVLRKVNREPVVWPDIATELACPGWLLDRWNSHFGAGQARKIAAAALQEPTPYIRIPPGSAPPSGISAEPTSVPGCFRLRPPPPPGLRLHDISSQAVIPLLGLEPGHTYLDLCAAPGNKTVQALETPLRLAVAADVSPRRIREIPPVCARIVLDATRPLPFASPFDRIFIDAPCSGTGTLSRNPEIKWRVQRQDFSRFREKQMHILSEALRLLAPAGKILYATCSLEQEENEEVARAALAAHPELRCEQVLWRLPGRDEGDGFYAVVLARADR